MSNGHDDDDKTPPPDAPDLPRVQRPAAPPAAPAQGGGFRPIVTAPGGRKPTAPGMPLVPPTGATPAPATRLPTGPPTGATPAPATRLPTISPTTAIVPPSQNPVAGGRAAPTIGPAPLAPVIAPAVAPGTPRPAPAPQRPPAPVIAPPVMAPLAPPTPVIAPPVMAPIAQRPAGPVIAPPVMSPAAPARPAIAPPVMSPAPPRTASSGGVLIPPAAPNTRPPTQPPGAIVPPPPAPAAPARPSAPPSSSGSGMRRASPIPESGAIEAISPAQAQELRRMATQLNALDYFQVLGLSQAATGGEIKKAFYRESRTYHPDRFFHIADEVVKDDLGTLYKRITEAYYVLKDDQKRKKYLGDIASGDRLNKLRYTEASEVEVKAEARKVVEEEFGTNPKSRPFFKSGLADFDKGNWEAAIRNLKMGLMYEPGNARFKEKLAEAQKKEEEERRKRGPNYMIK